MKKTVIAATVLCLTAGTPIYSFAADPCEVVLCMYGKLQVIVVGVNAVQQNAHFLKSTHLKNTIVSIRVKHSICEKNF
ncbi:putative lipoprotein [Klebsiella pneumoniae]|nr:putative lipoprotein [Klebsiella pneumoniae]